VTEELLRLVTNKNHERHLWSRRLKVGALVVLTQNTDFEIGLVNGSVGTILSLDKNKAEVRFKSGVHTIERRVFKATFGKDRWVGIEQMPLWCCWAMTVHRSQGMTLDAVEIKVEPRMDYGQFYTALSRVRSLSCLTLRMEHSFDWVMSICIRTHPAVQAFNLKHT
jgi:ATP-dependent DNA helicase PIF1